MGIETIEVQCIQFFFCNPCRPSLVLPVPETIFPACKLNDITELGQLIQTRQKRCRHTYGYRRMWIWLKKQGIYKNPKTVLRVMKKYESLSEIRRPRKWFQMGQQVHKYENLLNWDFQTDGPSSKWVTGISCIHTGQRIQLKAEMTLLLLNFFSLHGGFLCCPHNLGLVTLHVGILGVSIYLYI